MVNIFKVYTIKAYIINKECSDIRVCITNDYIIIRKYAIIMFFNDLIKNKPIKNKFSCQQIGINSFITRFGFFVSIKTTAYKRFFGNDFITNFLNQIMIKNVIQYRRTTINIFITHFFEA